MKKATILISGFLGVGLGMWAEIDAGGNVGQTLGCGLVGYVIGVLFSVGTLVLFYGDPC